MENNQYMEIRVVEDEELDSQKASNNANQLQLPSFRKYNWWLRVLLYTVFCVAGQSAATLLGRLYYDNGGNSEWISTLVQSAGFPIMIPLLCFFPRSTNLAMINTSSNANDPPRKPSVSTLVPLFLCFGLLLVANNLMYSYGLLYLPVSTFSLLTASQLAFNAAFSFFLLDSQKFTALIVNSLVLLTISAALLAVHPDTDMSTKAFKGNYVIGFLCAVGSSASYSLSLTLLELSFKKIIKREAFDAVLDMQIYPSIVATCASVVGLFASGEWSTVPQEMKGYEKGTVSYVMTLLWIAVSWQISSLGLLGLVSEVSSLFSSVINTIALPVIPVLAVIFFHDKMDGVKVIALILAIWGFLSYIYQHYLDDVKSRKCNPDEIDTP